jgi:hypothetical protein
MTDIHIGDFYKDVAKIFLKLYSSFPRKIILYVEDIAGADQPDEFGLHSERFLSGFSTMVWLADHGYLHFDAPIRQEALDQTVLSERGFLMLSSRSTPFDNTLDHPVDAQTTSNHPPSLPPSIIEDTLSNVTQLRSALRSGSSIHIQHCVLAMLRDNHQRSR